MSQLLASRIGQAPAFEDGELEARLQHFLSVLEVTLQATVQSDFAIMPGRLPDCTTPRCNRSLTVECLTGSRCKSSKVGQHFLSS